MSVSRSNWGLVVIVTFVMLLSSMGLIAAVSSAQPVPAAGPGVAAAVNPAGVGASSSGTHGVAPSALLTSRAPTTPTARPAALPTPSGRMSSLVGDLNAAHVPLKYAFLPNLNANPDPTLVNGHITPGYSTAPAPLGVAEYGLRNVSGTITPYTLSTSSVEGTYQPESNTTGLSQDISGPDEYGVQLNSVLNNVTLFGTTGYQFWTQNVIEYSDYSHQLFFVSNIWNFSGGPLNANTFYQVGPNGTVSAPELYYGLGGPITISYPFSLHLYLNSTIVGGRDAVYFNFTLANDTEYFQGAYDYAIFNSTVAGGPAAPAPAYIATGSAYNPIGLPNDFELTLGGPGGGSNFDVLGIGAYFGLSYWNSTLDAYVTVPSAYGYGSETGETAVGAYVLWGNPVSEGYGGTPSAYLTSGPSFLQGLWNVSSMPEANITYGGYLDLSLAPSNAFVFFAQGSVFTGFDSTNWSLFQWSPYSYSQPYFELDPGTYTLVAVLSNYDPVETSFTIAGTGIFNVTSVALTLPYDPYQGVYTPLWAFSEDDLANISNYDGSSYVLFNQQYGPLGYAAGSGISFPWFGSANDYLFPVFPGIFLQDVSGVQVFSPPSLKVYYPEPLASELQASGLPTWNDLQMLFQYDSDIILSNGANIGGWWYAGAYFGSAVSAYNVVFWNTTSSYIEQNTFNTGGNALYLYGGTHNLIINNTFEQTVPAAPDPYASVAGAYGSVGLFEADYGNATDAAADYGQPNATAACYLGLGYCDLVFNNIFLTSFTADSPLYDPYYFYEAFPTCPAYFGFGERTCFFDDAWNVFPALDLAWSGNIIGGPQIGGNYWWDYGSELNPYNFLPYDAYSYGTDSYWVADYLPLTPYSLYTVTFVETGLPGPATWYPTADINGVDQYSYTATDTAILVAPSGSYSYSIGVFSTDYAAASGSFAVLGGDVTVNITFVPAYQVTFSQSGLPSGSDWWVYIYDALTEDYLETVESINGTAVATGLLPGSYLWYAGAETEWYAANPESGTVAVAGNTSVALHYVPVHVLTVTATGLTAGAPWTLIIWNASFTYSWTTTGANLSFSDIPGAYTWAAVAGGYVAAPSQGTFSLASNETQTVIFGTPSTLTFTESGLGDGAAWTVALTQFGVTTNYTGAGTSIVISALAGGYNYTVSAVGYLPTTASGAGTLPGNAAVSVTFTASTGADGTLALTVTTSGASTTVNGHAVSTPFSQSEAPGVYAIVVSASGYLTYYNNVSVTSGQTTTVSVTLVATSSTSGASTNNGISTTAWLLIGLLAALAVIFLITTLLFSRRGRAPPTVTPYTAPTPTPTPAPVPGAPAWSEGPGTPPSPPPGAT